MIFVTVGTHQQAFDRMLDGVRGFADPGEVVVQYGYGRAPEGVARAVDFLPFDEMERCFEEADVVVTHAGVGSILCARRAGHVPIVVPRLKGLGEHVDDHQMELTRALAARGAVLPVWQGEELAAAVERVPTRDSNRSPDSVARHLTDAVRAALLGAQ